MTSQQREDYEKAKASGELFQAIGQLVGCNRHGVEITLRATTWVTDRQAALVAAYLCDALKILPKVAE